MRLFYTLITSGLLVLTEIPAEQPPPIVVYQDVSYALSHSASDYGGSQESVTYSSHSSFDQSGERYLTSSPITYLGIPNDSFPIQANPEPFEARQPPQYEGVRLQDGPELTPAETKASPTPVPKATAPTSVAMANSTTAKSALATYRQQSALPISGFAMFYNPNVMQEVLSNRLAMGQVSLCGECVGNVALLRAGDLNRRVWLQWADGTVEGPFLVADVAATQHVAQLLARNWVVDVDHSTAVRRKMAGPVWVTVWSAPPIGNELDLPPFAPLYSSLPQAMPPVVQAPVSMATVLPTSTPLPAPSATLVASPPAAAAVVVGFPTDTPVPTITPLPALNATATATVAAGSGSLATPIATPTTTPSPTFTPTQLPTFTVTPTAIPATSTTPFATAATVLGGFPTETPIPTNTALPALSTTATQPATPTITATQTSLPTVAPTMTPTATLAASPTVDAVVTQGGFPPDTPVPTITPLPAINPLPTPTVTPSTN